MWTFPTSCSTECHVDFRADWGPFITTLSIYTALFVCNEHRALQTSSYQLNSMSVTELRWNPGHGSPCHLVLSWHHKWCSVTYLRQENKVWCELFDLQQCLDSTEKTVCCPLKHSVSNFSSNSHFLILISTNYRTKLTDHMTAVFWCLQKNSFSSSKLIHWVGMDKFALNATDDLFTSWFLHWANMVGSKSRNFSMCVLLFVGQTVGGFSTHGTGANSINKNRIYQLLYFEYIEKQMWALLL